MLWARFVSLLWHAHKKNNDAKKNTLKSFCIYKITNKKELQQYAKQLLFIIEVKLKLKIPLPEARMAIEKRIANKP